MGWLQGRHAVEGASAPSGPGWTRTPGTSLTLRKFDYRATSPMYIDREIVFEGRVRSSAGSLHPQVDILAIQGGAIGMKGLAGLELGH